MFITDDEKEHYRPVFDALRTDGGAQNPQHASMATVQEVLATRVPEIEPGVDAEIVERMKKLVPQHCTDEGVTWDGFVLTMRAASLVTMQSYDVVEIGMDVLCSDIGMGEVQLLKLKPVTDAGVVVDTDAIYKEMFNSKDKKGTGWIKQKHLEAMLKGAKGINVKRIIKKCNQLHSRSSRKKSLDRLFFTSAMHLAAHVQSGGALTDIKSILELQNKIMTLPQVKLKKL